MGGEAKSRRGMAAIAARSSGAVVFLTGLALTGCVIVLAAVPYDSLSPSHQILATYDAESEIGPTLQVLDGAVGSEDCLCPGVPPNPATVGTQFTWTSKGDGNKDLLKDYVEPDFSGMKLPKNGKTDTPAPTQNKFTCKCNYGNGTPTAPTDASGSRRRLLGDTA